MPKHNRRRGVKTAPESTSKVSDGGGSDDSDNQMSIDRPIEPYFSCHGNIVFQTTSTSDRSAPYRIHHGTEVNEQMLEVWETNYPQCPTVIGSSSKTKVYRKALHITRYENTLSEILNLVQITQLERVQGVTRSKLNSNRELIKGIMREFCYLMEEDSNDDILYLQHPENYIISGYNATRNDNINDVFQPFDEFSTEIHVHFVSFKRSGGGQRELEDKLENLKSVLLTINQDDNDLEWTHFISTLNVHDYKNTLKHWYLWHWDSKLGFVDDFHRQLNLNGEIIKTRAKLVFNGLECLERDWENSLRTDYPINRVCTTKISVDHGDDDEEEDECEGNAGGQSTSAGAQSSSSAGGQGSSKGKGKASVTKWHRALTAPEIKCKFRRQRGIRLVSIVRNSIMHVSQGRWVNDGGVGYYGYDNIREGFKEDAPYKYRKHLYVRLKEVLPELWTQMVPAARNRGFLKY